MSRLVAVVLLTIRCCHCVPQQAEEAYLGPESPAGAETKRGGAATGGSMIRAESPHGRRGKRRTGGGAVFEVKPSGELRYHSESIGSLQNTLSARGVMGAIGQDDAATYVANRSIIGAAEVIAHTSSGEDTKEGNTTLLDAIDPDASGVDSQQAASISSGSRGSPHENATVPPDLSSPLPMEKLALLQSGPQSGFPAPVLPQAEARDTHVERTDQLPGERLIGEMLQESGHASTKGHAEGGGAQIPGMANAGDLAFRAMDMMLGTTGIIASDYPFACICNAYGTCERDIQNTPCPHRAGQMAGTRRSVRGGVAASLLAAVLTVQSCF